MSASDQPTSSIAVARWDFRARFALAVLALGAVLLVGVARTVEPDPRGFGTHEQLGLSGCAFRRLTGWRCPTCGMTTALAWAVRGRWDRACGANPAGLVFLFGLAVLVPWLWASAIRGRPAWGARSLGGPFLVLVAATVAVALAAWIVRLVLGRA